MKIVTWNINSIRLRLPLLQQLMNAENPDIICLQETKVRDELFPEAIIKDFGYEHIVFTGEKSYNGVAILSKIPLGNSFSLRLYNEDKRHIAVQIAGIELHNFYVPAGGDIPDTTLNSKFYHKLEYVRLMRQWFTENRAMTDQIIICGDLNIAPHENDVWSSTQLRNVVSHTDVERAALINLQNSLNFVDTARHYIPMTEKTYSWWSYRNVDWAKSNRGRRLDHIWVSNNVQSSLANYTTLKEARNWLQPSDHIPCVVSININQTDMINS